MHLLCRKPARLVQQFNNITSVRRGAVNDTKPPRLPVLPVRPLRNFLPSRFHVLSFNPAPSSPTSLRPIKDLLRPLRGYIEHQADFLIGFLHLAKNFNRLLTELGLLVCFFLKHIFFHERMISHQNSLDKDFFSCIIRGVGTSN